MISPTSALHVSFLQPSNPDNRAPVNNQQFDLCVDLIYGILMNLGVKSIAQCSQVCRSFSQIAASKDLWRELFNRDFLRHHPSANSPNDFVVAYKECHLFHTNVEKGRFRFASQRCLGTLDPAGPIAITLRQLYMRDSNDKNTIQHFDVSKGQLIKTLKGHQGAVSSLLFGNGLLFSGSEDTTIKIWNVAGECLNTLKKHKQAVEMLALGNGQLFSSTGSDEIKVWSVRTGECLKSLLVGCGISCLAFGCNQLFLTSQRNRATVQVWDVEKGMCITDLSWKYRTDSLACYFGKLFLFSKKGRGVMEVWNAETLERLNAFKPAFPPLFSTAGESFSLESAGAITVSNYRAEHRLLFEQIAFLFKNPLSADAAMMKFKAMPERDKQRIYQISYEMFKTSNSPYPGCEKNAFMWGLTAEQKAQAIEKYLNPEK